MGHLPPPSPTPCGGWGGHLCACPSRPWMRWCWRTMSCCSPSSTVQPLKGESMGHARGTLSPGYRYVTLISLVPDTCEESMSGSVRVCMHNVVVLMQSIALDTYPMAVTLPAKDLRVSLPLYLTAPCAARPYRQCPRQPMRLPQQALQPPAPWRLWVHSGRAAATPHLRR